MLTKETSILLGWQMWGVMNQKSDQHMHWCDGCNDWWSHKDSVPQCGQITTYECPTHAGAPENAQEASK